jgi:hypothetical protein
MENKQKLIQLQQEYARTKDEGRKVELQKEITRLTLLIYGSKTKA